MILKRAAAEKILGRKIEAPAWKGWYLLSADGTKNLGGYRTREEAVARERAVQYFKHNPISKSQLRSLLRRYSSAEEFEASDLSGFGAKSDVGIIELIVSQTRGRVNMRALREGISGHGRWWFLTEVSSRDVDAGTHGTVAPSGEEDLRRPIVIGSGGEVLDGRHRVMAARERGVDLLPAYAPAGYVYRQLTSNPRKSLYIYPNKSAIAAAKRGLKAREQAPKSKRGGLDALQAKEAGVGSGVLRARDIIAGKRINAYQVKAFFDRHQGNYISAVAKGLAPERSKAIQAWLIWGGNPLYRQVKSAVERDKKGLKMLKKDITKPNPKRKVDQISGGLADKYKASDFDPRELRMGVKVEMEHTKDRKLAKEIAMDHLVEFPNYYTALEEMEEGLSAGKKKAGFLGKDHDWDEVLIDKGGKKLTRKKILDHYKKVEKKIWPFLKGQTVMVYIGTGRNKSVLRRKGPDGNHIKLTKLKGIEDPSSLEYWTHRRVIEFHPVITGTTTPLVWVDMDPKFTKANESSLRRKMNAAVPRVKSVLRKVFGVKGVHVYTSGKRGIHVEGNLPRAMSADRIRRLLRAAMDDEFSDDKVFTTRVPKAGQIRLDTNLIKHLGSIRAPYSMSVTGRAKLPVKAKAKSKKKAAPRRRKNPDDSSLFHVTYVGRLAGVVEDGLAPGRGPSIGGESYDWNRRDSIFLSESDGVDYWYDLASRWAFDSSDDPAADGLVPVVLRISGGPLTTEPGFDEFCEDDEVGWEDSNRPTYKCKTAIDPKYLQVWTGSSWVPVRRYGDIDLSSADDMHTWEDTLMPVGQEMESGKRRANPRRRRKPSMRRRRRNPDVQELSSGQYARLKNLATDRKAHLWDEEPELEHIGIGGERVVYGLAVEGREPFAFKVDQGTKLHRQTEFEVKCLVKSNNPLAPDIFDWDHENYRWIEMELMTSLPDTDDPEAVFEEASGIDWDSWSFAFETYGGYLTDWNQVVRNLPKTAKAKRFIAMVRAFVEDCELATSELGLPDNWGVTRDGKLKPLDLGY